MALFSSTTVLPSVRVARGIFALGCLSVVGTSLFAGPFSPLLLVFGLWALLPYGAILVAARWSGIAPVVGAGASVLAGEIGFRLAVFVYPSGSTAGIALLFSPILLTLMALPAGWLAGWLIGRLWRLSKIAASLACLAAAIGLYLFALSIALPEETPWAVRERERWQEQLGNPRVVLQPEGWIRELVSERSGWVQSGELDGRPGDEIAIVDHKSAQILDPLTLAIEDQISHGSKTGSKWNWFSRLVRFDRGLVIVQTGGGFQETKVIDLEGRRLWRYRPSKDLPPSALRPTELDGDGQVDLVAVDGYRLLRLDQEGQELWERSLTHGTNLVLAPYVSEDLPSWIVTWDSDSWQVWAGKGEALAKLDRADCQMAAVVDLAIGRRLLCGSKGIEVFDLDGRALEELYLDGLTATQASTALLSPHEPPYLVVVSSAPSDVERWRVAIYATEDDGGIRSQVYEEITDTPPGLVVAHTEPGYDVLFLRYRGSELWRLGPASGEPSDPPPAEE